MLTKEEIQKLNKLRWRKFSTTVILYIVLAPVLCLTGLSYVTSQSLSDITLEDYIFAFLLFSPILFPILAYCVIYTTRLFETINLSDLEQYALYLRPFLDDDNTIDKNEFSEAFRTQMPLLFTLAGKSRSFDTFLSKAFKHTGITTISLGNPKDLLPKAGTKKIYPNDSEWKEYVSRLIDSANIIFFRCSDTESFRWELEYLIDKNLLRRSLMHVGLEKYESELWPQRASLMRKTGVIVPDQFPGFGATIGFTDLNKAFILTKTATSPRFFSNKVALYLKNSEQTMDNVEWNSIPDEPADVQRHLIKIWRKQFLRNPLKLGLYGIILLSIWIFFVAFWIYAVYLNQTEMIRSGTGTQGGSTSAMFSAFICIGILWIFTYITSPFFAKKTVQRLKAQGKRLEDII